jgi:cytochrome c553
MPGCQIVYSVIDRNGKRVADNVIGTAKDEAVAANQDFNPLLTDMAPVQPHSAQRKARSCESCHNNPKSMGYGIGGGVFQTKYPKDIVEDLINQTNGKVIPKNYKIQINKIPALKWDWSTIVDKETGNQVQVVGSHWPLSRALNKKERDGMDRTGLCMGCHKEMTNDELWKKVSSSKTLNYQEHIDKMNEMLHAKAGK